MTGDQADNPLLDRIPLGRMGETEDVAEAAAYLAMQICNRRSPPGRRRNRHVRSN